MRIDAKQCRRKINWYLKIMSITDATITECADYIGCSRGYLSAILNHRTVPSCKMMGRIDWEMKRLLHSHGVYHQEPRRCKWKRKLKANGITQSDAATAIGVSRPYLSQALNSGIMSKHMEMRMAVYMKDIPYNGRTLGGGKSWTTDSPGLARKDGY